MSLGWRLSVIQMQLSKADGVMGKRWCHGRRVKCIWMHLGYLLVPGETPTPCVLLLEDGRWLSNIGRRNIPPPEAGKSPSYLAEYLSWDKFLPLLWPLHSPTSMADISHFPMNWDTALGLLKIDVPTGTGVQEESCLPSLVGDKTLELEWLIMVNWATWTNPWGKRSGYPQASLQKGRREGMRWTWRTVSYNAEEQSSWVLLIKLIDTY